MTELAGQTAIVTGAGGGNGRAIAAELCQQGANVVCADIDEEAARRTAEILGPLGSPVVGVGADHTVAGDCHRVADLASSRFGAIDVLVNNAGSAVTGAALDVTEADLLRQLRVNVIGPLLMSQATLPKMIDRGSGSIVMIASVAGVAARPGQAPYVVSKHALVGLMRSLAADYGRFGIRVNAVCPEMVRTAMTEQYIAAFAERRSTTVEQAAGDLGSVFPLGRFGDPSDVAAAVAHLASGRSSWVTGQAYVLDGGLGLVRPQPRQR